MNNANPIGENITRQVQRSGLFAAVITLLFSIGWVVYPSHRTPIFTGIINGLVLVGFLAICYVLTIRYKWPRHLILQTASAVVLIDLQVMEGYFTAWFNVPFTPVFTIACIALFLKLMFDHSAENRRRMIIGNLWTCIEFLIPLLIVDFFIAPRIWHHQLPLVVVLAKVSIVIMPLFLMVYAYRLLVLEYHSKVEEVEGLNTRLVANMRFVISGEAFSSMVHDMRNLINSIRGTIELVKMRVEKSGSALLTEAQSERLDHAISQALKVTSVFISYLKMDRSAIEPVRIGETLEKAIEYVKAAAGHRQIVWNVSIDPDQSITRTASAYRLVSVFLNIMTNAMQAFDRAKTPEPMLMVKCGREGQSVCIVIADNGPGFEKGAAERIFAGYTTRAEGNGLGLSFSHRYITTELSGTMTASPSPAGGAQFTITFPLNAPNENTNTSRPADPSSRQA